MNPAPAKAPAEKDPGRVRRKIFLVDDHAVVRNGLAELINQAPDLVVSGEAATAEEALEKIEAEGPDLAVVDLTLGDMGGLELLKHLKSRHPLLPVLVLSMHDESFYAERCLRAGARGYIMKNEAIDQVERAVRQILDGKVYLSQRMSARILEGMSTSRPRGSSSPIEQLTDREFEVFQLIGQGKSTRDIAEQLHLSTKTVDVHRSHIKEKLELKDATALIRHAVRWIETRQTGA